MAAAKTESSSDGDAHEQIRALRDQVDKLMQERVAPILSEAVDRAEDAAHEVGDIARDQSEALSKRVRENPITALLIAAAAGFVIGRISR